MELIPLGVFLRETTELILSESRGRSESDGDPSCRGRARPGSLFLDLGLLDNDYSRSASRSRKEWQRLGCWFDRDFGHCLRPLRSSAPNWRWQELLCGRRTKQLCHYFGVDLVR